MLYFLSLLLAACSLCRVDTVCRTDWGNGVVKVTVGESTSSESMLGFPSMLSLSMIDHSRLSIVACCLLTFVSLLLTFILVLFGRVDFSGPGRVDSRYSSVGVLVLVFEDEISN